MKPWQPKRENGSRLALAGAVFGACTLIASPAPASARDFLCSPQGAGVFPASRIHIRCNPGDGAIAFFGLSIVNADASRVLSVLTTAVAARRPILIQYDPSDLSGAAFGCATNNCRVIQGIELQGQ